MTKLFSKLFHKKNKNEMMVYGIFLKSTDSSPRDNDGVPVEPPLYFASNYEEARTVVSRMLYIKYYDHYKMWCTIHEATPGFTDPSWDDYLCTLFDDDGHPLNPTDVYLIRELHYEPENFTSFLRMFSGFCPLFLPHEYPEELMTYLFDHQATEKNIPPMIKKFMEMEPEISDTVYKTIADININKKKIKQTTTK